MRLPVEIEYEIADFIDNGLYGCVKISFRNGVPVLITREETILPSQTKESKVGDRVKNDTYHREE